MSKTKNRPEIDGLRAVAVIPVVLYHAGLGIKGGYVGVDVFFVISGFLITSLIVSDLNALSFRFANFWERRVRRILPALVVMVVASLGVGWALLLPSDFDELGRSVVAQSLLSANFFFWQQTGYFTADATQPLLHTWSLAVEEQFYLLFPFFLVALHRFDRRVMVWAIGLVAAVSFALNLYLTHARPMAAFYLLPPRAWELLLGAFVAVLPTSRAPKGWRSEAVSLAGFIAIVGPAFLYTKETPFPGVAALLPCVGAAAIIWSNSLTRTGVGKLLALRPFVFVGLVSYSFYLWHWPVFVFATYGTTEALSMGASIAMALGSFALAVVSWKFVETPFRKRSIGAQRSTLFALAAGSSAALVVAGFLIHRQNGLVDRWSPAALQYLSGRADRATLREADLSSAKGGTLPELGLKGTEGPIELLVWGDSHAKAVLPVLDAACSDWGVRGVAATHAATAPLLGFKNSKKFSLGDDSIAYNQAIVDFVKARHVRNVLVVARWSVYLPSTESPEAIEFSQALRKTIDELRATGARIYVMKDVPGHGFDVPRALAIASERSRNPTTLGMLANDHRASTQFENDLFDQLVGQSVSVLDPIPFLADQNGLCRVERDGRALYADRHHLSTYGAMQLRPLFEPIFRLAKKSQVAEIDIKSVDRKTSSR